MSNKLYDILKWIALTALPAISVFYIGLALLWGLPYADQISGTIMLVDTLLGTLLGVSSIKYAKKVKNDGR